jgi:PAS domain-containing protein
MNETEEEALATDIHQETMNEIMFHALDDAPEVIIMVDSNSQIIYANRIAPNIFGYTNSQLIGKHFVDLIPEHYREEYFKLRKAFWSGETAGDVFRAVVIIIPAPRKLPGEKIAQSEVTLESRTKAFTSGNGKRYAVALLRLVDPAILRQEALNG